MAVFNGELYAVGGFDGTTGLDTVEKYNPSMSTLKCTDREYITVQSWPSHNNSSTSHISVDMAIATVYVPWGKYSMNGH